MIIDRYAAQHSSESAAAARAFEAASFAVLAHRPGAAEALAECQAGDADFAAAPALRGFGAVLLARAELKPAVEAAVTDMRAAMARRGRATAFESALAEALPLAAEGRLRAAAARLAELLKREPENLLALKLCVALNFMGGDTSAMRRATEAALSAFRQDQPGHGFILGCHAFALEESGERRAAERYGRRAAEIEPADAWGLHAVAHVFEMENRTCEGIDWLEETRANWQRCNNFSFHIAWHLALFHLAGGDQARALALYDSAVRPEPTDDFRDIANAVSLLKRLEQEGVSAGRRWDELAAVAEKRQRDSSLMFASLHYLIALKAAGRDGAAERLADTIRKARRSGSDQAEAAEAAVPLAALISGAPAQPDFEALPRLGGSDAQRDIFLRIAAHESAARGWTRAAEGALAARQSVRAEDRFSRALRRRMQPASETLIARAAAFAG